MKDEQLIGDWVFELSPPPLPRQSKGPRKPPRKKYIRVLHVACGLALYSRLNGDGEPVDGTLVKSVPVATLVATGTPLFGQTSGKTAKLDAPVPRVIVCAANRLSNGRIVIGVRHCDQFMHQNTTVAESADRAEQGFVDQHGLWYDRRAAWDIACEAGQIRRRVGRDGNGANGLGLFSENLY